MLAQPPPGVEVEDIADVDVETLDYAYIEKCTNVKELESIIAFLKCANIAESIARLIAVDQAKKAFIRILKTLLVSACIHWTPVNACAF